MTPASSGHAADSSEVSQETVWQHAIAPYGWLPGIYGDTAVLGLTPVEVDLSPLDFGELLIENLDFALIGALEARRDEYGVLVDIVHLQLSTDKATPGPLFGSINVGIKQTMLTGMGSYRAVETQQGHLDFLAGARLWNVDVDLSLSPGFLGLGGTANDGDTWVDPMVGVKGSYSLDEHWSLTGWGMIGAGSSDISWDIYAAANYKVSEQLSMIAGYRAVGIDYQNGGFLFDLVLAGPVLGAVYRF